jgi:hypothetical protein
MERGARNFDAVWALGLSVPPAAARAGTPQRGVPTTRLFVEDLIPFFSKIILATARFTGSFSGSF